MKFTKQQIETGKQLIESYKNRPVIKMDFENYLDSLLKTERKKIIVEIEYDSDDSNWDKTELENVLSYYRGRCKVTELPEVFTREDIDSLTNYLDRYSHLNSLLDLKTEWLSERKQK